MAKNKRKVVIRVLNSPSGKAFTSLRSAKELVARGRAMWSGPGAVELLPETLQEQLEQKARREQWEADVASEIVRRGASWWNGGDRNPLARHRPGEVRS